MKGPLGILDELPFGKHKGDAVGEVCEEDPGWLLWAINNTDLRITPDALNYLNENLRDKT